MKAASNIGKMGQMRTLAMALLMSLAATPLTYGYTFSDYTWIEYNGHLYARTLDYCDWQTAQMWAQEVGGHLVVVDDAAENAWLAETFKGLGVRSQAVNYDNSLVWIGLQCIGENPMDLSNWQWVTGQPLTYPAQWYFGTPTPAPNTGNHAYLHTNTHHWPQSWWNNGPIEWVYDYNPYGVIEIDSLNPSICANLNIDPDVLNLHSKGKWITAYVTLAEGYDVRDVAPATILLNEQIAPAWSMVDEEQNVLTIKFDRSAVQQLLQSGEAVLVVMGTLTDGTLFCGTDTIRVIDPGKP